MSYASEAMREACINPMFTVDQQVMKVTNCSAAGDTVVPGGVEPQVVPLAQSPHETKGTVDAEPIQPGEDNPQTDPKVDPPAPVQSGSVMDWVKKNPGIAIAGAAALFFIFSKRRSR